MTDFTIQAFLNPDKAQPGNFTGCLYAGNSVRVLGTDVSGVIDLSTFAFGETVALTSQDKRLGLLKLWKDERGVVRMVGAVNAPAKALEVVVQMSGDGAYSKTPVAANGRTFAPGELLFKDVRLSGISLKKPLATPTPTPKNVPTPTPQKVTTSLPLATIPTPAPIKRTAADLERQLRDQVAGR